MVDLVQRERVECAQRLRLRAQRAWIGALQGARLKRVRIAAGNEGDELLQSAGRAVFGVERS
jgi:hypothetical protein